jgi:nitrogen fixation/metabolism regulation signal transduction histidine kinase
MDTRRGAVSAMSIRGRAILIFTIMSLLYTGALIAFMFYLTTTALDFWEQEEIETGLVIAVNNAPDTQQQARAQRALKTYRQLKGLKSLYEWQIVGFSILIGITFFVVSVIVISLVLFRITRPLRHLATVLSRTHDEYIPLKIEKSDREIAQVLDAYNAMTDQLRHSRERLKQAERIAAWRDAARIMAHEVRNPLTAMRLSIERLRKHYREGNKDLSELMEKSTTMVLSDINALEKLTKEFSDFARLPEPVFEPVDLNALISDIIKDYEHFKPGIKITIDSDHSLPDIMLDRELMRRVFHNLFKNAFDAIKKDTGRINVSTQKKSQAVLVTVEDTGPGIDSGIYDRVFDPYFTTKAQGSGLGLAVVKQIITEHNGIIALHSTPGMGTVITIELPISNDRQTGGINE